MDRRAATKWVSAFIVCAVLCFSLVLWTSTAAYGDSPIAEVTSIYAQLTPTAVDPTVSALQKRQLTDQVTQLEDENDRSFGAWLWNNAATLLSVLFVVASGLTGGLFGYYRWRKDRIHEQEKEADERFRAALEGLGGESIEIKVGAAAAIRTFLLPGYEERYSEQVFRLIVANLRFQRHADSNPDPLDYELAAIFKEAVPRTRNWLQKGKSSKDKPPFGSKSLDATAVRLEKAHLSSADLKEIWMPKAFLRGADLEGAEFNEANLSKVDFTKAHLEDADFTHTNLAGAKFIEAFLIQVQFHTAVIEDAKFDRADLTRADFSEAKIRRCSFEGANLTGANFTKVDFEEVNLLNAASLTGAELHNVTGLPPDQLKALSLQRASVVPPPP
jgi:uncharacterized protein YjbI with pentapeptide repeats